MEREGLATGARFDCSALPRLLFGIHEICDCGSQRRHCPCRPTGRLNKSLVDIILTAFLPWSATGGTRPDEKGAEQAPNEPSSTRESQSCGTHHTVWTVRKGAVESMLGLLANALATWTGTKLLFHRNRKRSGNFPEAVDPQPWRVQEPGRTYPCRACPTAKTKLGGSRDHIEKRVHGVLAGHAHFQGGQDSPPKEGPQRHAAEHTLEAKNCQHLDTDGQLVETHGQ